MKVGITLRVDNLPERQEKRETVDQSLIRWVIEAGHTPILIPNLLFNGNTSDDNFLRVFLSATNVQGLILSGGHDVGLMPERDLTEYFLLDWAEQNKLPVLGICRGMQIMSLHAGTKLVKVDGHIATRHKLIARGLNGVWPDVVNSYHGKTVAGCPVNYSIAATTSSGHIEAITHNILPWEGWMWHPEREVSFREIELVRFRRLVVDEN